MSESRIVTGHTVVMVRLAEPEGGEAIVQRGQALPDNLAKGEIERLEKVGAFAEPPRASLAGQGARPAFAPVPEIEHTTTDALAPRGDLGLPLPPQVTLNANAEADGGVAKVTADEATTEGAAPRRARG